MQCSVFVETNRSVHRHLDKVKLIGFYGFIVTADKAEELLR